MWPSGIEKCEIMFAFGMTFWYNIKVRKNYGPFFPKQRDIKVFGRYQRMIGKLTAFMQGRD
jgi:hypothetical protein